MFIFGWKITSYFDLIFVVSCLLIFYVFIIMCVKINKKILFIFVSLFILCTYALLIVVLNGSLDLQMALRSIRAMLNFLGGGALVYIYWYKYKNKFMEYILLHIFLVLTMHAFLIIVMYLNESVRLFVYNITDAYSIVNLNYSFLSGLRITGLTYGLSQTSALQTFGILLTPAIFYYWGTKKLRNLLIIIGVIFLFISIFLTGRSGLFLLLIMLPSVYILIRFFRGNKSKYSFNFKKKISTISRIIVVLVILSFCYNSAPEQFFSYNLKQAEEVIEFFTERGETRTTQTLSNMIFLPDSALEFFFGSSNLGRGALGGIPSDIGFVRGIFAIGILGTIIMLIPYIYATFQVMTIRKTYPYLVATTLCILASSFLLHFKEVALYTRNQWSIQSLLICLCILIKYRRGNKAGKGNTE